MTDSLPSSSNTIAVYPDETTSSSSPSTATKARLKKIPPISSRGQSQTNLDEFSEAIDSEVADGDADDDIVKEYGLENGGCPDSQFTSTIAASALGLNSIRTRSVPTQLRISGLGGSSPKAAVEDFNKREAVAARRKFIVPDGSMLELGKKTPCSQSKSLRYPSPLNLISEGHAAFGKEIQSPRFRAIIRATSGRKKKAHDIKSFSHELNSKGVRPFPFWKSRALGHMEEVMVMIRAKFDKLKEEVNNDLGIFAGDLVSMLEQNSDSQPDWKEGLEDLLIIAQQCAKMSPNDFWLKCESIVQNLDDRRQELPMGNLKRSHTRLLFILTRCSRLVQFQKESGYEEDHILYVHQLSDLGVYPEQILGMEEQVLGDVLGGNDANEKLRKKSYQQEHSLTLKHDRLYISGAEGVEVGTAKSTDSSGSNYRMSSWKKLPGAAEKNQRKSDVVDTLSKDQSGIFQHKDESVESPTCHLGKVEASSKLQKVLSGAWGDQQQVTSENLIICRICEVEIPTVFVEEHSRICTIADKCDQKGLTVNERLGRVAEALEKVLETWTPKSSDIGEASLEVARESALSMAELDELSPRRSNISRGLSGDMLDCVPEPDHSFIVNILHDNSSEAHSILTPDVNNKTSSAGSLTPRSPLTPQTSQIELLLNKKRTISDHENYHQIKRLLDIAHSVAGVTTCDYGALEYMLERLEDLQYSIQDRKVDALVVETFGRCIEKLLQEKYVHLCGQIEDERVDSSHTVADEESSVEDDTVRSLRASPINPGTKDRTSIEDFEIIKPISRGAFGRVFLARKRATGDLFAIKVLRKADMIRKNAVESILAERNILISARNPFVVRFFYSFTCKDNLYLVMEYLNGGDLYSLLRNLGCLEEDMVRVYIAEVVLALEYLHSLNVIHRDLKPDNLLIGPDGHIKLTDFGLSRVGLINSTDDLAGPAISSFLSDDKLDSTTMHSSRQKQREKNSVVGTPDYLAPEILLGMGHGATADWWSVGVILFELLVGIPPFNASTPQQIFDNIMNRDIPWPMVPEEMSVEAYDLINKLLTENPVQRLGATGSREVKDHPFFKDINWDTLARQKAMFIPSADNAYDTGYFMSRYIWNPEDEHVCGASDFDEMTETGSDSCTSGSYSVTADEDRDECGSLADFCGPNLAVKYSFSNFSFKNLSQLASINYDMVVKTVKETQDGSQSSIP